MDISRRSFCKSGLAAGAAITAAALSPVSLDAKKHSKKKGGNAKRVIIMTFDGIRVDGLAQAKTPYIDRLIKEGAASMATRDVMPSVTLPNYTSHLLGAGPEVHGVDNNDWLVNNHRLDAVETDEDGYFPNVFKVLKDNVKDIKTAFFWNWEPLINPHNRKYFDRTASAADTEFEYLCDQAIKFLRETKDSPSFTFLYNVWTDHVGHNHKWMSREYIKSIEESDAQIGKVIDFLKKEKMYKDTHILFTSDHGGVGNGHGGVSPEEMIVPWVWTGPGIKKGFTIEEPNNTVNTASTVLHLFGVEQPACWTGEVPMSIYE